MSILYTVRSRFTDPAREDAWNEWYAGHLEKLLRVPGFLAAQRFHSDETVDDRPYLAMYEVEAPEVFQSDAYVSIWGFDEWRPLIDNWTRDIFEPRHGDGLGFGTPRGSRLRAAFLSGDDRPVEGAMEAFASERPALHAAAVAGLDRSCAAIAWETPADDATGALPEAPEVEIAQALYEPLTERRQPAAAREESA
jgi:hypothetical protein